MIVRAVIVRKKIEKAIDPREREVDPMIENATVSAIEVEINIEGETLEHLIEIREEGEAVVGTEIVVDGSSKI